MDQNLLSFFLGIIAGLISSALIVWYVYNENSRKDLNLHLDLLFKEIDFNRTKLPTYEGFFKAVKEKWSQNHSLDWINHNEISIGYGGFLYNFFKFDAYNLFTVKGLNLYFESNLDNTLKKFYYDCKMFCARTQANENRIRLLQKENKFDIIDLEWDKIESEFNTITEIFLNNQIFSLQNVNKFQINWVDWHIKKMRIIDPERKESTLTNLLRRIFPFGVSSALMLFMILLGFGLMLIGTILIQTYITASISGITVSDTWIGPLLISLGFAFIVYGINIINQLNNQKKTDDILKGIQKMTKILENRR